MRQQEILVVAVSLSMKIESKMKLILEEKSRRKNVIDLELERPQEDQYEWKKEKQIHQTRHVLRYIYDQLWDPNIYNLCKKGDSQEKHKQQNVVEVC